MYFVLLFSFKCIISSSISIIIMCICGIICHICAHEHIHEDARIKCWIFCSLIVLTQGLSLNLENFCPTGNLHDPSDSILPSTEVAGVYLSTPRSHMGAEDVNSGTHAYWSRTISD